MGGVRKWSHAQFHLSLSKTSTIDKFLESLIPRTYYPCPCYQLYVHPIMLYESGEFPSGAKGERNVPLKYITKDRCKVILSMSFAHHKFAIIANNYVCLIM